MSVCASFACLALLVAHLPRGVEGERGEHLDHESLGPERSPGETPAAGETLDSMLRQLVPGSVSGEQLSWVRLILEQLVSRAHTELKNTGPECRVPSWAADRACLGRSPVFGANLTDASANDHISWAPDQRVVDRLREHARGNHLVLTTVLLAHSVDGIFSTQETFANENGFWYVIAPMWGCYASNGAGGGRLVEVPRGARCTAGRRRWYVFVATRGTQSITEGVADVGLYEEGVRSDFIGAGLNGFLWMAEHLMTTKVTPVGFALWPLKMLNFFCHGIVDIISEMLNLIPGNGTAFRTDRHKSVDRGVHGPLLSLGQAYAHNLLKEHFLDEIPPEDLASPPLKNVGKLTTLPEVVAEIRSWATTAAELLGQDAKALAKALVAVYGPSSSQSGRALFCGPNSCPESDEAIEPMDTVFVFVGHSMGGAAAQLQGIQALQHKSVKVAVLSSNAPGVHDVSLKLKLRKPRAVHWTQRSWYEVDPDQKYDTFLNLVSQHDVVWKVDRPLTEMGQRVCMYHHPSSQSSCGNYSHLGELISASCISKWKSAQRRDLVFSRRCTNFLQECFNKEHNWGWRGKPTWAELLSGPVGEATIKEMLDATGKTKYSSLEMPSESLQLYLQKRDEIDAEVLPQLANLEKWKDQNLGHLKGGLSELSSRCCPETGNKTCGDGQTILPCDGRNMYCAHGSFDFFKYGAKSCWCKTGTFYYPSQGLHSNCTGYVANVEAAFKAKQNKLEDLRENKIYDLDQVTDWGVVDKAYGGSKGKWLCSKRGDGTWKDLRRMWSYA